MVWESVWVTGMAAATIGGVPGRALIVDDHPSFRAMARALLAAAGFDVVAEAADGASALAAVREHRPDCVLLDVQLPDADGFEVAGAIAAGEDPPAVVLTSSRAADDFGSLIERSSVRGFITKERLSAAALAELWR
jgi:CheY-like chemotaxis protein